MNHDHAHDQQADQDGAPPFWRSRYAIGLLMFSAVAAYFLLSEHRAHFFGALPFLLLLACLLMHMFMHRDHRGHDGVNGDHSDGRRGADTPASKTGAQP